MSVETPVIAEDPLVTPVDSSKAQPESGGVGIRLNSADYSSLLESLPASGSKSEQISKAAGCLAEIVLCTENSPAQIKHFVHQLLGARPRLEGTWEKVVNLALEQVMKVALPSNLATPMERFYVSFVAGSENAKLQKMFDLACKKLPLDQFKIIQNLLANKEDQLRGPRLGMVERVRSGVKRLMESVGLTAGFREKITSVFGSKDGGLALQESPA